jgi:hypothetical protein
VGADANIDVKALKAALAPSRACATVEQLSRLCDADHAGSADARLAGHVAGCLRCRTELALLKQFESGTLPPGDEAAARRLVARLERDVAQMVGSGPAPSAGGVPERRAVFWEPLQSLRTAIAGVLVATAMLLLALNLRGGNAGAPPLSPDIGGGQPIFRSDALAVIGPVGDLETVPTELRWETVPGAAWYSVQVTEVDRTELWKAESAQASVALPTVVRARIVPGKPLLWQVVAKDESAKTVATSAVQRFRLRMRQRQSTD